MEFCFLTFTGKVLQISKLHGWNKFFKQKSQFCAVEEARKLFALTRGETLTSGNFDWLSRQSLTSFISRSPNFFFYIIHLTFWSKLIPAFNVIIPCQLYKCDYKNFGDFPCLNSCSQPSCPLSYSTLLPANWKCQFIVHFYDRLTE